VPVNWAIIKGEQETGASLHHMALKPDAGNLIAQQRVPILPDDQAADVFRKVCVAAELCLDAALPGLLAGTAPSVPLDLARGSYFGGRKAEDGRIDWQLSAVDVHNLVRAVAPPYPGAWMDLNNRRWIVQRTRVLSGVRGPHAGPALYGDGGRLLAQAGDGGVLRVFELAIDGQQQDVAAFAARLAFAPLALPLASEPARA
jgi:methionyl-tRNA formyltransferase